MSKHAISVITVCRNEAKRIGFTAQSIAEQDRTGCEWLVIDGASTDDTIECLSPFRSMITHLISEPDRGLYDAMNKAILMASGAYLLFLNAGDRLADSSTLADFVSADMSADLVVGDILVEYPDGSRQLREAAKRRLDPDLLYWRSFPHQSTFIRRSLFEQHGLYDLSFRITADWDFFARMVVRHNVSVSPWSRCIAIYSHDGISARTENRRRIHQERNRIRRRYYPFRYRLRRDLNETIGRLQHRIRNGFAKDT